MNGGTKRQCDHQLVPPPLRVVALHEPPPSVPTVAQRESVIKCPSPLNILKDAYDHSCY